MLILKLDNGLRVMGCSSQLYYFEEHFYHAHHLPELSPEAGVYLFLRKKNDGKYYPVFCGETTNLAQLYLCKASQELILEQKPNRICILYQQEHQERERILHDILSNTNYNFSIQPSLAREFNK